MLQPCDTVDVSAAHEWKNSDLLGNSSSFLISLENEFNSLWLVTPYGDIDPGQHWAK